MSELNVTMMLIFPIIVWTCSLTPETSSGFSLFGTLCADKFPLDPSTPVYMIRMMRSIATNNITPRANIQLETVYMHVSKINVVNIQ